MSKLSRFATLGVLVIVLLIFTPKTLLKDQCPQDPTADNIVVVIKTGATEASEKIPMLMQTSLRCVKHVLFFSDLEQDIGPYHLYDALETISPTVMQQNPEFDFYQKQQDLWRSDGNISSLKGARDPKSPNDLAAWTLDKYKNIHIIERTWELLPDKAWYILIDADTYIIWQNLLSWIPSLDPSRKAFFGSKVFLSNIAFTHGGSGTILSRSSMFDCAVTHKGTAAQWDPKIHEECCGDYILSKALVEYGSVLGSIRPSMSGQKPATMPFSTDYWCQPTFTLHHVQPSDMKEIHNFERRRRDQSRSITHAEMFEALVKESLQSMPSVREDWDNISWKQELGSGLSGGKDENFPTESFEECAAACEANMDCFQFLHDSQSCFIGKSIRLGERREAKDGKRWRSGWHQGRIADWISRQKPCDTVEFPDWHESVE